MGFLSNIFGSKPDVPDWTPINANDVQAQTISGNAAALPAAESLASKVNLFNMDQINSMLSAAIPDFKEIMGNVSGNIASMTRGELPSDVINQIQDVGAARGFATGTAGGQYSRNLTAKDLGLTSLNLTTAGLSSAQSWLNTTKSLYPTMDVTSMFFTPQQRMQYATNERDMKFQHDYLQNQIDAMGDPMVQGLSRMVSNIAGPLVSMIPYVGPALGGAVNAFGSSIPGGTSNTGASAGSGGGGGFDISSLLKQLKGMGSSGGGSGGGTGFTSGLGSSSASGLATSFGGAGALSF